MFSDLHRVNCILSKIMDCFTHYLGSMYSDARSSCGHMTDSDNSEDECAVGSLPQNTHRQSAANQVGKRKEGLAIMIRKHVCYWRVFLEKKTKSLTQMIHNL